MTAEVEMDGDHVVLVHFQDSEGGKCEDTAVMMTIQCRIMECKFAIRSC